MQYFFLRILGDNSDTNLIRVFISPRGPLKKVETSPCTLFVNSAVILVNVVLDRQGSYLFVED